NNIDNEKVIKNNEGNFRILLDAIGDLVVVAKPEGEILFTNKAFQNRLGYKTEDLKNIHVLDLNPKENRKEAEQIFADMFAGKRDFCPLPIVTKDGVLIPAETRAWFGKWDDADCIFGIIRDLSQDQEDKQKFERLFRSNPSPMAISSTSGNRAFSDVNDAFLEILGYSKDEVVGKNVEELSLFLDLEQQISIAKELKDTGHISNKELKVRCKNGEIIDGLFFGEIIKSQGKEYFLTVMLDITLRKKSEEKIKFNIEELEKMNKTMVGCESETIGLKKEIEELKANKNQV
ncbi:MAG: PAS domain S-box protein, partial [bacterium]